VTIKPRKDPTTDLALTELQNLAVELQELLYGNADGTWNLLLTVSGTDLRLLMQKYELDTMEEPDFIATAKLDVVAPDSDTALDTAMTTPLTDWDVAIEATADPIPDPDPTPDPTPEGTVRGFQITTPLFAATSPWNQKADLSAVMPNSTDMIAKMNQLKKERSGWDKIWLNHDEYAVSIGECDPENLVPVLVQWDSGSSGWPSHNFAQNYEGIANDYPDGYEMTPNPTFHIPGIAGGTQPSTASDKHLCLLTPDRTRSYDYWQANLDTSGQLTRVGMVDFHELAGLGTHYPMFSYSARASGVPLLGGLIIPEDWEQGEIRHALCFGTARPGSDRVYPATASDGPSSPGDNIPMGSRIRLKSSIPGVDEGTLNPMTKMIFKALREYGAYLVDTSGDFAFYMEDIKTAYLPSWKDLADSVTDDFQTMPDLILSFDLVEGPVPL
jgi:hypothetical protein